MIDTSDFRNGIGIILDNEIFTIIEFQHVKPGKGGAFVRTRLKNVRTGATIDTSLFAGRELMLLFLSPGCRMCWRLADGTRKLAAEPSLTRMAVCRGGAAECAGFARALVDRSSWHAPCQGTSHGLDPAWSFGVGVDVSPEKWRTS